MKTTQVCENVSHKTEEKLDMEVEKFIMNT